MQNYVSELGEWPILEWEQWKETAETLHMYMQIVGKTRLAFTPIQNHWWNVPLYVTARGLSTSAFPVGNGHLLDVEFDFLSHELVSRKSEGNTRKLPLQSMSVADFFAEFLRTLKALDVKVEIDPTPVELANPIRFNRDAVHASYDKDAVSRFWRVLIIADTLEVISAGFWPGNGGYGRAAFYSCRSHARGTQQDCSRRQGCIQPADGRISAGLCRCQGV